MSKGGRADCSRQKKTPVGEEVDGRLYKRRWAGEEVSRAPIAGNEGGGSFPANSGNSVSGRALGDLGDFAACDAEVIELAGRQPIELIAGLAILQPALVGSNDAICHFIRSFFRKRRANAVPLSMIGR